MPIYEYKCENCGIIFEKIGRFEDPSPLCPICEGTTKRVPSVFSFRDNSARISEREKRILRLAKDYLKDNKVEDATRFLQKSLEYVKTDKIKKAYDALSQTKDKKTNP